MVGIHDQNILIMQVSVLYIEWQQCKDLIEEELCWAVTYIGAKDREYVVSPGTCPGQARASYSWLHDPATHYLNEYCSRAT